MAKQTTKRIQVPYAQLAVDHSTDAILVTDAQLKIEWVNPGFLEMTGYTFDDVVGKRADTVRFGADSDPATTRKIGEQLKERRAVRCEVLTYTKTGRSHWVELSVTPIFNEGGQHTHFLGVERDISERRALALQTEEMMAVAEFRRTERRILTETAEWLYSAKSLDELMQIAQRSVQTLMPEGAGQIYIYSNSRDTLDLAANWGDDEPYSHFHPDECWALRRGRAYAFGRNAVEFPCGHVEADDAPYFCLPIIAHGETIGLLHLRFAALDMRAVQSDTMGEFLDQRWETAQICAEQISLAIANVRLRLELKEQSVSDQLTGLWNRRWFLETAGRAMRDSQRHDKDFALISIDVDHFKTFNDHHGHDAGDLVLREVGALMHRSFEGQLSPCRIGGEEFMVIVPGRPLDDCLFLAESFRQALSTLKLDHGGGQLPPITASVGIAMCTSADQELFDLMKRADQALYAAKADGRDCTRVFSEELENQNIAPPARA